MHTQIALNSVEKQLIGLTDRFIAHWQKEAGCNPYNGVYDAMASPCVEKKDEINGVYWLPVRHETRFHLDGVERGMEMKLHEDTHSFYGTQYAGDISVQFRGDKYLLLQTWSEEDFVNLQENIIAHLVTQRKAKRQPSVFIGTTEDDDYILTCCNLTGNVLLERLFKVNRVVLATDLSVFLAQCEPVANFNHNN